MINNSYVWKKDLKKELNNFRKLVAKMDLSREPGIPDIIYLKVEKFFFVSAFIIRKLKEAKKLSDELNEMKVSVAQFERINKDRKLHFMNNHDLEKFYDLANGRVSSLSLGVLCNTLIHSFVFRVAVSSPEETDGKETVSGIFVNSDYNKDKALYFIQLEDFFNIVEETISDNVVSSSYNIESGTIRNSRKPSHDNLHQIVEQVLG